MLRVARHESLECLPASLRTAWDRLPMASPMESPDWLLTWWETFASANDRLSLLTVWDGPELVGVAPCYIRHHWSGRQLRRLGDQGVGTRGAALSITAGREHLVPHALALWLRDEAGRLWDSLAWEGLGERDAHSQAVMESLEDLGCVWSEQPAEGDFVVEAPERGWLAPDDRSWRQRWFRMDQQYFRSGRASIQTWTFNNMAQGWQAFRRMRNDVPDDGRHHAFHLEALPRLMMSGKAELRMLRIDDAPVSMDYLLLTDDTIRVYARAVARTRSRGEAGGLLSDFALLARAQRSNIRRLECGAPWGAWAGSMRSRRETLVSHFVTSDTWLGRTASVRRLAMRWMGRSWATRFAARAARRSRKPGLPGRRD